MTASNKTPVIWVLALAAAATLLGASAADAQKGFQSCLQGTLSPPPTPVQLIVKNACQVPAGTYVFGDVHVLAGGTLSFSDATIDFWASTDHRQDTTRSATRSGSVPKERPRRRSRRCAECANAPRRSETPCRRRFR